MEIDPIRSCTCSICRGTDENPTRNVHRAMNYFFEQLGDHQQALYLGLEAKKRGPGSERGLSVIFGWDVQSIAAARRQLEMAAAKHRLQPNSMDRAAGHDANGVRVTHAGSGLPEGLVLNPPGRCADQILG